MSYYKIPLTSLLLCILIFLSFSIALESDTPFIIQSTNAMYPVIKKGDILLVEGNIEVKPGDIALIKRFDGSIIIAEVVMEENGKYIVRYINPEDSTNTKGEKSLESVRKEEIKGRIYQIDGEVIKIPRIGYLKTFFSKTY